MYTIEEKLTYHELKKYNISKKKILKNNILLALVVFLLVLSCFLVYMLTNIDKINFNEIKLNNESFKESIKIKDEIITKRDEQYGSCNTQLKQTLKLKSQYESELKMQRQLSNTLTNKLDKVSKKTTPFESLILKSKFKQKHILYDNEIYKVGDMINNNLKILYIDSKARCIYLKENKLTKRLKICI